MLKKNLNLSYPVETHASQWTSSLPGLLGATNGKKLFDGAILTVKYFFDVINTELSNTVLCRNVDRKGDIEKRNDYLKEAHEAGSALARVLQEAIDKQKNSSEKI